MSIPTCQLWLDAADASTVTGTNPITAWTDKSGNGRTVTITSGPTYGSTFNGQKTLTFNNNEITTSIASAIGTGDFTLIAVWYQSSSGTNTVLSLGTSASSSQSLGFSANKYNFYQYGSAEESAYTSSAGNWVIQIGTRISSVKAVYINGVAGTTPSSDSYNQTVTTVTIGKGDGFAISGQIGEILLYTGTMTTTQRQTLESYLAQKWGLLSQLALSHLHYTLPAGLPTPIYIKVSTYLPPPPLYSFTSFTFTNAGATIQNGPILSQCVSAYTGASWLSNYFTMTTQGYQLWTVPASRSYTVICAGASSTSPTNAVGYGYGAIVAASIYLTAGQKIQILVGQMAEFYYNSSGGGGGTFFASGLTPSSGNCIVAAGGGGGYSPNTNGGIPSLVQNGRLSTTGNSSSQGVAGGSNGGGGGIGTADYSHGGAGFIGNGIDSVNGYATSTPALSFINGGIGGRDGYATKYGGFGGGGAQGFGWGGGGGAGGYSGGAGSGGSSGGAAGGGGSFPSSGVLLGLNLGQGYVTISTTLYSQIPSGGSISISTISTSGFTIIISSMTNAMSYTYYLTTSGSSIASPVYSASVFSPATISITFSLSPGSYYAALVGTNTAGVTSPIFSAVAIIPGPIATVTLSSISASGGTLTWSTATSATGYAWYVGTGYGTGVIASGTTNSSTTTVNFSYSLTNSYYYGWVQASTSAAVGAFTYSLIPIYYTSATGTLYSFSSFTFTNAGATLQSGPTLSQCTTAYSGTSWTSNTDYFNMTTQGYQLWTVPTTGTYTIVCAGASCVNPTNGFGYGAIVGTTMSLSIGQKLQILVGQMGQVLGAYSSGGGGSFIASGIIPIGGSPLLVGGGGGGYLGLSIAGASGQNASFTTSGNNSGNGIAGGTNGYGASSPTSFGGGGAGFYGNGTISDSWGTIATAALSFVNGGTGGSERSYWTQGGFGGGGIMNYGQSGGGGGGGYSGGAGAYNSYGGGGGSFPSNAINLGYNVGHGVVIIVSGTYNTVPTGGSATLSGFSLTGVTITISPATNVLLYKYYITTSGSSIASPIYSGVTGSTTISVTTTLSINTTYYVAITPINLQGSGTTVYSSAYDFSGSTAVGFSSISTTGFTLSWTAASLATGYNWYFGTSVGGASVLSGSISSTSVTNGITLSASTTYYAWVVPTSSSVSSGPYYATGGTRTSGNVSFTYTGYLQLYYVPSDRSSISVTLAGAGGGGNGLTSSPSGGSGALVSGTLAVTAGQQYYIIVGGGALGIGYTSSTIPTFGGGGLGYTPYGCGGGGRSAMQLTLGTDIVDAGGGGGAGSGIGGAGGATGGTGGLGYGGAGVGATQTTGGANYTGGNGTAVYGGGGGGGFYGGGGGQYGGGGGGSSLTSNLTGVTVTSGGGGAGGGNYGNGGNGYITIT